MIETMNRKMWITPCIPLKDKQVSICRKLTRHNRNRVLRFALGVRKEIIRF